MANNMIVFRDEDWDKIHESLAADNAVGERIIQPLRYLFLLEKHGGFDAGALKKVPRQITVDVAKEMGIEPTTLLTKRAEWSRKGMLDEARTFLKPFRDEQLAIAVDYAESAMPEMIYRLVEKGMHTDTGPNTLMSIISFLKNNFIDPARQKKKDEGGMSKDDEYAEKLKELDK